MFTTNHMDKFPQEVIGAGVGRFKGAHLSLLCETGRGAKRGSAFRKRLIPPDPISDLHNAGGQKQHHRYVDIAGQKRAPRQCQNHKQHSRQRRVPPWHSFKLGVNHRRRIDSRQR